MKILLAILFCSAGIFAQNYSSCLPKDVKIDELVSAKLTVKKSLQNLKAKCTKGKLVDSKKREIKFYRLQGCWGNPPQDYLEILDNQQKELAELKKKYTVIEISCNPNGMQIS